MKISTTHCKEHPCQKAHVVSSSNYEKWSWIRAQFCTLRVVSWSKVLSSDLGSALRAIFPFVLCRAHAYSSVAFSSCSWQYVGHFVIFILVHAGGVLLIQLFLNCGFSLKLIVAPKATSMVLFETRFSLLVRLMWDSEILWHPIV